MRFFLKCIVPTAFYRFDDLSIAIVISRTPAIFPARRALRKHVRFIALDSDPPAAATASTTTRRHESTVITG